MADPTRRLELTEKGEVETDSLSSVELGESAPDGKGMAYIKSAKAYGFTIEDAGKAALAEFRRLQAELKGG